MLFGLADALNLAALAAICCWLTEMALRLAWTRFGLFACLFVCLLFMLRSGCARPISGE